MLSLVSRPSLLRKFGPLAAATMAAVTVSIVGGASAFVAAPAAPHRAGLGMGMFDMFADAFKNEEYDDRRATASHILVATEEEAAAALESLGERGGAAAASKFAAAARERSTCPSAADGGMLGTFAPGDMAREFEDVVFDEERAPVGEVVGPVRTEFGWHLILVQDRSINTDRSEGSGFF